MTRRENKLTSKMKTNETWHKHMSRFGKRQANKAARKAGKKITE